MTDIDTSSGKSPKAPDGGPDQSAAFHTAIAHLYRAEMQRMTVWRTRLDTTTHWAILLTAGITTFALGSRETPHVVMLLGLAILTICMAIEGRRYQHLNHSRWRIGLLEHNYFAGWLCPDDPPLEPSWRRQLAADLVRPHITIDFWLATRLRLRRNYLMLCYFVTAVWLTKVFVHPSNTSDLTEFYRRLAVGSFLPSWFVAITAVLFVLGVTLLGVTTPSEEALENWTRLVQKQKIVGETPEPPGR